MKRDVITIAGSLGSGKSSTAKAVAAALGFRHFSSGDLFRRIAAERGESIEAMNISAEVQRDIDLKVDNLLQDMYRKEEKLTIDLNEVRQTASKQLDQYAALEGQRPFSFRELTVVVNARSLVVTIRSCISVGDNPE